MCKIGYKVVRGKKSFRPATSFALQRIRYRIGETTTPDDSGPFAVFSRLRHAARWAREYGDCILLVEYEPAAERTLWKRNPPRFCRSRYGRGHGYYAESQGVTEKENGFPEGTDFAAEVRPLRVVQL